MSKDEIKNLINNLNLSESELIKLLTFVRELKEGKHSL